MKKLLLITLTFTSLFYIAACGGGGGGASENGPTISNTGLPTDISGLFVLQAGDHVHGGDGGIFTFELTNGRLQSHKQLTTRENGINPYAHARNIITYSEPCDGTLHHRTLTINENGFSSEPIVKCSSDGGFYAFAKYKVAKFSPDRSKLALLIETPVADRPSNYAHLVKVYDMQTKTELANYDYYTSPDWHPDGRLLLTAGKYNTQTKGIFITDRELTTLNRIDQEAINQNVSDLDVHPSGNQLIFTMAGNIWIASINDDFTLSNYQEVINSGDHLVASWSPDGRYLAYLSFINGTGHKKVTLWNVESKNSYVFDTKSIFPVNTHNLHWLAPQRFVSWVE